MTDTIKKAVLALADTHPELARELLASQSEAPAGTEIMAATMADLKKLPYGTILSYKEGSFGKTEQIIKTGWGWYRVKGITVFRNQVSGTITKEELSDKELEGLLSSLALFRDDMGVKRGDKIRHLIEMDALPVGSIVYWKQAETIDVEPRSKKVSKDSWKRLDSKGPANKSSAFDGMIQSGLVYEK